MYPALFFPLLTTLFCRWNHGSNLSLTSISLQHFRQLKIITAQLNYTVSHNFLPSLLLLFCVSNILSTFLTVSYIRKCELFNNLNLGHLVFPSFSLETYLGIVCLTTLPGSLHKKSTKFLVRLRIISREKENKSVRKEVMACSPLKIKFCSNFIAVLTPLVMVGLCVKWTIKLLVVTN